MVKGIKRTNSIKLLVIVGSLLSVSNEGFAMMPGMLDAIKDLLPRQTSIQTIQAANSFMNIACDSDGLQCLAVGYTNGFPLTYKSGDGGATWNTPLQLSPSSPSIGSILLSIACDTQGINCISAGGSVLLDGNNSVPLNYLTTNSGSTWNAANQALPVDNFSHNAITSIACNPTAQHCIAVGYTENSNGFVPLYYITSNGGSNWTNPTQLPFVNGISSTAMLGIVCDTTDASHCLAIGIVENAGIVSPVSYATADGGATWKTPRVFPSPIDSTHTLVTGISCDTNAQNCVGVGASHQSGNYVGIVYTTTDGGTNWSSPASVNAPAGSIAACLSDVACNKTGLICNAIGFFVSSLGIIQPLVYESIDSGATWNTPFQLTLPGGNPDTTILVKINCDQNMNNCLTVGTSISGDTALLLAYASSNGGASWSAPILPLAP